MPSRPERAADLNVRPDVEDPAVEMIKDVLVDADPGALRRFLTDAELLAAWLGGDLDADVRPGAAGRYRDEDGREHRIVFRRPEADHEVSWTWWPEDDPDVASTVTVSLVPEGTATRVRVHERLGTVEASVRRARADRWETRLGGLALRLAGVRA